MLESLKNKRILIVAAHPDDELLGLGATMHKLINNYHVQTHVVIIGEGITSRSMKRDIKKARQSIDKLKKNIKKAQSIIGYHSVSTYDLPDNRFDSVDLLDIIKIIEKEKQKFLPEIIFTHHGGDLNIDHQRTFEAVITACRPMKEEKVKKIISFETPSSTEWQASNDFRQFVPNLFISISNENLDAKIKAMECYELERRSYPHPRSPEALKIQAQRWGVATGNDFAEAFRLIQDIS
jgi:LmbE family N-acetylglucosaminyl deacetylase